VRKIGDCNSLHAKILGLYFGLELARRDRISHLCVENYSKLLIGMVTNNFKTNGTTPWFIRRIINLLGRSWRSQVHHT
jgi:hypothetical protein